MPWLSVCATAISSPELEDDQIDRRYALAGGTRTYAFGSSKREGHDSSPFYSRFADRSRHLGESPRSERAISPRKNLDAIFLKDARSMDEVDDASVALVVTSPPYFAGKEYELEGHPGSESLARPPSSFGEYLQTLEEVFAECTKKLEPGGRIAVNVANIGRRPFVPLAAEVMRILSDRLGLNLRAEIVWRKARGASGSCAWGSFCEASNPVIRDTTERVIVASKGSYARVLDPKARRRKGLPADSTTNPDEFMAATLDVWEIPPESANKVGHPAPFPVALPERLILLYTYKGDLVLDPFAGSGTTAVAAVRTGRHFVCYETVSSYVELARKRIQAAASEGPRDIPAVSSSALAWQLLKEHGFMPAESGQKIGHGFACDIAARHTSGRLFRFVVTGRPTVVPDSMSLPEQLLRVAGLASLAKAAKPNDGFGVVELRGSLPSVSLLERLLNNATLDIVITPEGALQPTQIPAVKQCSSAPTRSGAMNERLESRCPST